MDPGTSEAEDQIDDERVLKETNEDDDILSFPSSQSDLVEEQAVKGFAPLSSSSSRTVLVSDAPQPTFPPAAPSPSSHIHHHPPPPSPARPARPFPSPVNHEPSPLELSFAPEMMGLGCKSLSSDQALEVVLKELWLRQHCVRGELEELDWEEEEPFDREAMYEGEEEDEDDTLMKREEKATKSSRRTLSAITELPSSRPYSSPPQFDLASSLEAKVDDGFPATAAAEEGMLNGAQVPLSPLSPFFGTR